MKMKLLSLFFAFSAIPSLAAWLDYNPNSAVWIYAGSTLEVTSSMVFKPEKLLFFQNGVRYTSLSEIDPSAPYCHASIQTRYYQNFSNPIKLPAGAIYTMKKNKEGPTYVSMQLQSESGNYLFLYCYAKKRVPMIDEVKISLEGSFSIRTIGSPPEL